MLATNCDCARPKTDHIVSRHVTSQGVVTYARCVCGKLWVRLYRDI